MSVYTITLRAYASQKWTLETANVTNDIVRQSVHCASVRCAASLPCSRLRFSWKWLIYQRYWWQIAKTLCSHTPIMHGAHRANLELQQIHEQRILRSRFTNISRRCCCRWVPGKIWWRIMRLSHGEVRREADTPNTCLLIFTWCNAQFYYNPKLSCITHCGVGRFDNKQLINSLNIPKESLNIFKAYSSR